MPKIADYVNAMANDDAPARALFTAILADMTALRAAMVIGATGSGLVSTPTLQIGTGSAAKTKHVDFTYQINGVRIAKASSEITMVGNIADPDANGREAIYVLSIQTNGTITVTKGADAALGAGVAPATLNAAHLTTTFTTSALAGATPGTLSLES